MKIVSGRLFTDLYCERTDPTSDSPVLRRRIGSYIQHTLSTEHWTLHQYLGREAGFTVEVASLQHGVHAKYEKLMLELPTVDLLNCITHVWRYLWSRHKTFVRPNPEFDKLTEALSIETPPPNDRPIPPEGEWRSSQAEQWRQFVERVLREENISYRIDAAGGIHPAIDVEFEHSKQSLIRGLSDARYASVRAALEEGHGALGIENRNMKLAVRAMFEALEILTKLMVPSATRLDDATVKRDLGRIIRSSYSYDSVATSAALLMIESLAKWVNSMQIYRHGQGTEEPTSPPAEFAVCVVSTGSAWLRFLLEIDSNRVKQA